MRRTLLLLVFISQFLVLEFVLSDPCVIEGNLPDHPTIPSEQLGLNEYPINNQLPIIQDHWSEVVESFRPSRITPEAQPTRTLCPHLEQNLKHWHDSSTWSNGLIPQNNADITLPANTKVLFSSCSKISDSTVYGTITIPASSELIFNDEGPEVSFRAKGFVVNGKLRAGSPTCRLHSKLTITLHGSRANTVTSNPQGKGIFVNGGELSLHGARYTPTWTRLARTANIGDDLIFIQDLVNWEVNQTLVITTTEIKDSRDFNRNEKRKIVSVKRAVNFGPNVSAVRLSSPLAYKHYAGLEYQAEVALLSRRVMIQGDEVNSEPIGYEDPAQTTCYQGMATYPCDTPLMRSGFGGHIMITGSTGKGTASGVELYRMGQTNVVGRYPWHFHMIGDGAGSFIQDSSVHRSFFRCYTVHGTNNTRLSENVAYDAIGHCYYLEDGIEENNLFEYNLGAHIHTMGGVHKIASGEFGNGNSFGSQGGAWLLESADLVLPADISASAFYITSASNSFIGNTASGGFAGFSFPNLPRPVKLSAVHTSFCTKCRLLTKFQGNTAHSTGYWFAAAAGVYVGGTLRKSSANPNILEYTYGRDGARSTCVVDAENLGYCPSEHERWMLFENTKVFLVNGRGMQHWGNRVEVVKYEVHDVGIAANVFGEVIIKNMLANCRSSGHKPTYFSGCNATSESLWWPTQCNYRDKYFWGVFGGFEWYDVFQRHLIQDSEFRNCNDNWNGPCLDNCEDAGWVWSFLTHSDQFVPDVMQSTRGITYTNVNPNNLFQFSTLPDYVSVSGRLQGWYDVDGTAARAIVPGRTSLGSARAGNWWNIYPECELREELYICHLEDDDDFASIRLDFGQLSQVGNSQVCTNGAKTGCDIRAYITHFGRTLSDGLPVAINSVITGLIASDRGGWFLRFVRGAPKSLKFDHIQVRDESKLILAIAYPLGATFQVIAHAPSWCDDPSWCLMTYSFQKVNTLSEVVNGDGTKFFVDSSTGYLYVRIVQQHDGSLGNEDTGAWILTKPYTFTRFNLALRVPSYDYYFEILASNCGGNTTHCGDASSQSIPSAFSIRTTPPTTRAPTVPTTMSPSTASPTTRAPTTKSPTKSPTTKSPTTRSPTTSSPTKSPTTKSPTKSPTTKSPTKSPTTKSPTTRTPTNSPTTRTPTNSPITSSPTTSPTTKSPVSAPVRRRRKRSRGLFRSNSP